MPSMLSHTVMKARLFSSLARR
ncbi:MAG: hypothetical protein AB7P04_01835 [Bacteriovoracia bacterium]